MQYNLEGTLLFKGKTLSTVYDNIPLDVACNSKLTTLSDVVDNLIELRDTSLFNKYSGFPIASLTRWHKEISTVIDLIKLYDGLQYISSFNKDAEK